MHIFKWDISNLSKSTLDDSSYSLLSYRWKETVMIYHHWHLTQGGKSIYLKLNVTLNNGDSPIETKKGFI